MAQRALISVYDKTGIVEFSRFLLEQGYALLSTGGTYRTLKDAGFQVTEVSEYTGVHEMFNGRVKTLHPKIHGGILGCRDDLEHRRTMDAEGIDPIEVVVVNLYPFFAKSSQGLNMDELVEFIDIGGPTMLRGAAKNHRYVNVISDPLDYVPIMAEWNSSGGLSLDTRRRLAAKVFRLTGAYDSAIAADLSGRDETPELYTASYRKAMDLRYGENPHQKAGWYVPTSASAYGALSDMVQHQGKELSFNNIRDLDGAWRTVIDFKSTACVGVKHAAPCGAALGTTPLAAWEKARNADPISIFGGIAAFNCPVDKGTALSLCETFLEVVAAPDYSQGALEVFRKKKNLRVLSVQPGGQDRWEALPVDGGLCLQEVDRNFVSEKDWTLVTNAKPTEEQFDDLVFAWKVVKHVKSNGIVVARDAATLGIGSGQPNRVGAVSMALGKGDTQGAVLASDAFFPFDDGVKAAAEAGITAIVQPGGSIKDQDSIKACNDAGIAMMFTRRRHFRH